MTREDEDLLLELLNTTPVVGNERVDHLADSPTAENWARAQGGAGTAGEIRSLRSVRGAIQDVTRGRSPAQVLARQLERIALRPRLHEGSLTWELDVPADETLAARALLAWATINERAPGRLRPCANSECCRFLLDRSRANTAQWCSMAICGNRFKARRHYRRTRSASD
ncbi:CGNR zinc finger domain-containing protein [Tamaricihabitans halophyticus]|uniref:CGNR zinc finger domain-containing protein n=1 Tax=Tamaricihabitans halophyticus TaxID=1262583 RepID=UPI00104EA817